MASVKQIADYFQDLLNRGINPNTEVVKVEGDGEFQSVEIPHIDRITWEDTTDPSVRGEFICINCDELDAVIPEEVTEGDDAKAE